MQRITSIIVLCLAVVILFSTSACAEQENKILLFNYLSSASENTTSQLIIDNLRFEESAANKEKLSAEFKTLKSSPDFIDLSGYWEYYRGKLYHRCGGDELSADSLVKMSKLWASLKECELQLSKAEIGYSLTQNNQQSIQLLNKLSSIWKTNFKDWEVRTTTKNVFLISGYGLGLNREEPRIGQWYYYATEKVFRSADQFSEEIFSLIQIKSNREDYNKYYNPPKSALSLPQKRECVYSFPMLNPNEYKSDSSMVKFLRNSDIILDVYWGMFEKLGYTVTFRGAGNWGWILSVY